MGVGLVRVVKVVRVDSTFSHKPDDRPDSAETV